MTTTSKNKYFKELFPVFRPRNRPPPICGTRVNGIPTPIYALGWVRDGYTVENENQDLSSISQLEDYVLIPRWHATYKDKFPEFEFDPTFVLGPWSMKVHHIYLFYGYNTDRKAINAVVNDDELLNAVKDCMGVHPEEEYTLAWCRMPINPRTHEYPRKRRET